MLDAACDMLSADLRPVPPQPNCPQSMKIFDDHRQMAAEYVRVKAEMEELRRIKQQLQHKLNQEPEQTITPENTREYNKLKSEKDALLAFRQKLTEQLQQIEASQNCENSAVVSTNPTSPTTNKNSPPLANSDWVIIRDNQSNAS